MNYSSEVINSINGSLKDDLSKIIFMNRLLFSYTGDYYYIKRIVLTTDYGMHIYNRLFENNRNNRSIGIFGAGRVGRKLPLIFDDIRFECFIDNNKGGTLCDGLPVICLDEFLNRYKDGIIVIAMWFDYDVVERQVKASGVPDDRIINYGSAHVNLGESYQYFDLKELWNKTYNKEVLIDGGGYDGNNTKTFLSKIKDLYDKSGFAFVCEPESEKYGKIQETLCDYDDQYTILSKGLWNCKSEVLFYKDNNKSKIDEEGESKLEVDKIDNLISVPVSFIKMDIEGAEYNALLGAKETIIRDMPRLAICVYHKKEDIINIPKLIMTYGNYDLYLRHYSLSDNDTVLYAIPKAEGKH